MMDPLDPHATQCEQVSILYMASLYLALPSEFDTLVTRCHIYLKVTPSHPTMTAPRPRNRDIKRGFLRAKEGSLEFCGLLHDEMVIHHHPSFDTTHPTLPTHLLSRS